MIDLHTHTTESDGSFSPRELIAAAARIGLEALSITDHDTFGAYAEAASAAAALGVELVWGIELSTKFHGRSVHLLAYFLDGEPDSEFVNWITRLQASRHERNLEMLERLNAKGMLITLDEVRRHGRKLIGRPHFAAALVERGYAKSIQHAFDEFLDESASCYAPRDEPSFAESVKRIRAARGVSSLPHPCRFSRDSAAFVCALTEMRAFGLQAIEVFHSDHTASDRIQYRDLARQLDLAVTGGSDFHGTVKPAVCLGAGIDGNVSVPRSVLSDLRRLAETIPRRRA